MSRCEKRVRIRAECHRHRYAADGVHLPSFWCGLRRLSGGAGKQPKPAFMRVIRLHIKAEPVPQGLHASHLSQHARTGFDQDGFYDHPIRRSCARVNYRHIGKAASTGVPRLRTGPCTAPLRNRSGAKHLHLYPTGWPCALWMVMTAAPLQERGPHCARAKGMNALPRPVFSIFYDGRGQRSEGPSAPINCRAA